MEFEIQELSDEEETPVPLTPERKVKSFALSTPDHELTLSPKLSVAQVFTTYQDLTAKLAAAKEANEFHRANEAELQRHLTEIRTHAEEAKAVIDKRKALLEEENEELVATLESLPSLKFLQEQLAALKQIDREYSGSFDITPLVSLGILHPEDTIDNLPQRIQKIHEEIDEAPVPGIGSKERVVKENSLRRKIELLKTVKQQSLKLAQKGLDELKSEVIDLGG